MRSEQGVSLVELLAAAAITGMVITVVTSLIFMVMANKRLLQQQTDAYEAVRVPASWVTLDARFATQAGCVGTDFLQIFTKLGSTDYIMYRFASTPTGGPPGATEDPHNLHRWVVKGGVVERDDIVGWDLVKFNPDDPEQDSTWFGCAPEGLLRQTAKIHLVKQLASKSGTKLVVLEATGFLRAR
jgi:type II secretory pathway pseudopilin PulG